MSSLVSFPHLRETLYILQGWWRSHTFTRGTQHNENWKLSWCMQMYADARVAGYAMILSRHVAIIGQGPTSMWLYDQAKACMTMKDQVMRRWMLHGNVSRKGYGNALIGRYGGCFEEDIMRLMMTEHIMPRIWMHRRSFHWLSKWERAMHGTEEARKIWMVEVRTIEYSH